jgi:hypothetical protein
MKLTRKNVYKNCKFFYPNLDNNIKYELRFIGLSIGDTNVRVRIPAFDRWIVN